MIDHCHTVHLADVRYPRCLIKDFCQTHLFVRLVDVGWCHLNHSHVWHALGGWHKRLGRIHMEVSGLDSSPDVTVDWSPNSIYGALAMRCWKIVPSHGEVVFYCLSSFFRQLLLSRHVKQFLVSSFCFSSFFTWRACLALSMPYSPFSFARAMYRFCR